MNKCTHLFAAIQAGAGQNMRQRAETMEQHRGELYDQYQREEEDENETDRLELQILLRDVHLQDHWRVESW